MGRPRADASSPATQDRILVAAQEEFAAVGYGAARLADIAGRVGIRRPSVLHHFASKEALYEATVTRVFARLGAALMSAMQTQGPFADRLVATSVGYAAFLHDEPTVARIVLREILSGDGPGATLLLRQLVPLVDTVQRFVATDGATAIRSGLPVRAAIMSIASALLLRSAAGPLRDPLWGAEDHAEALTRALFLREEGGR